MTPERLIAEARLWLGTPYHDQAALRGRGADCIGFVRGAMKACALLPDNFEQLPAAAKYAGYSPLPDGRLMTALAEFLTPIAPSTAQPGDVVVMRFGRDPHHVGLLANYVYGGISLIHSIQGHGVVEHILDSRWRDRVVQAYAIPGVDGAREASCCPDCASTGGSCAT